MSGLPGRERQGLPASSVAAGPITGIDDILNHARQSTAGGGQSSDEEQGGKYFIFSASQFLRVVFPELRHRVTEPSQRFPHCRASSPVLTLSILLNLPAAACQNKIDLRQSGVYGRLAIYSIKPCCGMFPNPVRPVRARGILICQNCGTT